MNAKKIKMAKRFRVRTEGKDGRYCSMSYDFHELGVVLPSATLETAHVFKTAAGASNAIGRLFEAQKLAAASMTPDWKAFAPLKFTAKFEIEEFSVPADDASG